jgi:hypothetical protein
MGRRQDTTTRHSFRRDKCQVGVRRNNATITNQWTVGHLFAADVDGDDVAGQTDTVRASRIDVGGVFLHMRIDWQASAFNGFPILARSMQLT